MPDLVTASKLQLSTEASLRAHPSTQPGCNGVQMPENLSCRIYLSLLYFSLPSEGNISINLNQRPTDSADDKHRSGSSRDCHLNFECHASLGRRVRNASVTPSVFTLSHSLSRSISQWPGNKLSIATTSLLPIICSRPLGHYHIIILFVRHCSLY